MKKKIILCLGLFLILILFGLGWINFKKHKFQVVFLNIGQGDASLIQFSDGTVMLIDCGPDKVVLSKLGKYLPFYNRTIDYLLITHFDLDHYGGCVDVLKRYRVKNIISNGEQKNSDKYWLEWNKFKNQEQAKEIIINSQTNWQIAETVLEFLSPHPSLKLPTDANNRSIVFKLIKKDLTILFTGDIEAKAEKVLLEFYCEIKAIACATLKSKVLKVAHHGSDSSTSQEFLQAVNSKQATVSVGKNHFGHPSLRVLRRLVRQGIEVLRTDQVGDIIISK